MPGIWGRGAGNLRKQILHSLRKNNIFKNEDMIIDYENILFYKYELTSE